MRIALLADIHSNLAALLEVEKRIKNLAVDKVICLGDIVGYAAQPQECIEKVCKNSWIVLSGNHDWASVGKVDITYFNSYAKEAILWTKNAVSVQSQLYLDSLALSCRQENFICVHGSLFEPEKFHYLDNYSSVGRDFSLMKDAGLDILFAAHTHIPAIFVEKNEKLYRDYSKETELNPNRRYIVNVGSVGQPRDRNRRSCFCLFDTEKKRLKFMRVDYNIKKTQDRIKKEGLPLILAKRLEAGW